MRRAESARLLLLGSLLHSGPYGATRDDLMHLSGLSQGAFYKTIKQLLEEKTVLEMGDRYQLPMANLQNYRFKLWRDAEAVRELPPDIQAHVQDLTLQVQETFGDGLETLILVGSAAHGEFVPKQSDLDFVAVVRKQKPDFHPRLPYPVQLVQTTPQEFEAKLLNKDSFSLSALRYGALLEDRGLARKWLDLPLATQLDARPLRELRSQLEQIQERFFFFLRNQADEETAAAVKAYAVTLGRGMLSVFGELPSGKPDLLGKLIFYYGLGIESYFRPAFASDWKDLAELEVLWNHFRTHHGELARFRNFLQASSLEFQVHAATLVRESLAGARPHKENTTQIDWAFQLPTGERVFMEAASIYASLPDEPLERFALKLREGLAHDAPKPEDQGIFVFNPFNKKNPLFRSWEPTAKQQELAKARRFALLSSRELLSQYSFSKVSGEESVGWWSELVESAKIRGDLGKPAATRRARGAGPGLPQT